PYKIHLELYGCASYKGAYPLGLESGAINDEQIYQDDFNGVTSSYNPQNVRLNSPRQNGWRPWIDSIDNGVEYTFVSFKLDDLVTIDALDIQVGNLDEENNANTFHISFYDYWNENAAKGPLRYTTIPERTSNGQGTPLDITTPAYKKPFETWRYVFPYPIYTKHLYYTVLNHQTPLFHKIEFIGKRGFHAEHSWKMDRNDVFKDMARNHHFYSTPKYRHLAPEGPIQGFAESKLSDNNRDDQPLQSLPFENDDCLVNADYCKHGTTFLMAAKLCDDFKEDLVNNLPLSSFSYTGSPANCDDPSYIKFNDEENHWTPCDGSHLVLQLSGTPHVTMIAFKGRQSGFVKKFEVFHSWDGSQYHKIKFSSKNYFEKFSSQLEYLSFPHPIRMKWIKINVLEVIGDSPSMKLDLIECQATRSMYD
uniref:F5/8 type C domain-containing protein n=1 Tax=Clytia hemisphaerica TaxID=252671 RepID=A0A7M5XJ45_9CNID